MALKQYLQDHKEIEKITLCLDNDKTGIGASFHIAKILMGQLIQLKNKEVQLKNKRKEIERNKKKFDYVKEHLEPKVEDYYALISKNYIPPKTAVGLLSLAKNLPEPPVDLFYDSEEINERYQRLNAEYKDLKENEIDINRKISSIEATNSEGNNFTHMLADLSIKLKDSNDSLDEYLCPLCGGICDEIIKENEEIKESEHWLKNELELTNTLSNGFAEDKRQLKEALDETVAQIKLIYKEIKNIEKNYLYSNDNLLLSQKIEYAKANIQLFLDVNDTVQNNDSYDEISDLEAEIDLLKESIEGYGLNAELRKAETFLSVNMNKLAKTLDFEHDFKPLNLNFQLCIEDFDLYHKQGYSKVFLSDMGSGANWVSCHIALFLSFLRYFALQKNSPMPLILFFDQPSQVYFPHGFNNKSEDAEQVNIDLLAVSNLYKTIFDEVNNIQSDTGVLPQVILVDHVDGSSLTIKEEFDNNTRYDWSNGKALI